MKVWIKTIEACRCGERVGTKLEAYEKKPDCKEGWIPDSCGCCGIKIFLVEVEVDEYKSCRDCIYSDRGTCSNCWGVNGTTEISDKFWCSNFKREGGLK